MKFQQIDTPADLPRYKVRMHHFNSAYYPTYAAAARRFRELTQAEPTRVYEYTAPTPIGGAVYTTWYFELAPRAPEEIER